MAQRATVFEWKSGTHVAEACALACRKCLQESGPAVPCLKLENTPFSVEAQLQCRTPIYLLDDDPRHMTAATALSRAQASCGARTAAAVRQAAAETPRASRHAAAAAGSLTRGKERTRGAASLRGDAHARGVGAAAAPRPATVLWYCRSRVLPLECCVGF